MVAGPRPWGSLLELIRRAFRQAVLFEKTSMIFNLILRGRGVGSQGGEPRKGRGAEGEKEENRWTGKALVLDVFWERE